MKIIGGIITVLVFALVVMYLTFVYFNTSNRPSQTNPSSNTSCSKIRLTPPKNLRITGYHISWQKVSGATSYNIRIDNMDRDPWNKSCESPNLYDKCRDNFPQNGTFFPFRANEKYRIWVHAVDGVCGTISKPALIYFTNKVKNTKWFPPIK